MSLEWWLVKGNHPKIAIFQIRELVNKMSTDRQMQI